MKKIFFLFLISFSLFAQPTIIFTGNPRYHWILRKERVDSVLTKNGLTRDSEFHAVIENTEAIAISAFLNCSKLI